MKKLIEISFHILFWCCYILLLSVRDLLFHNAIIHNFWTFTVITTPLIPFVYFNLYVLIPKLLFENKRYQYFISFGLLLTLCTIIRFNVAFFFYSKVLHIEAIEPFFSGKVGWWTASSETFVIYFISSTIYLIQKWYLKDKYVKELENKNMRSELNLLKSQLQPHFLFNNLNTIYFLMDDEPQKAKELVVQLSDALSHQLYKANQDLVYLKEELDYLRSYIKMEQIRHQDFLTLHYNFPTENINYKIAPMLLITFIENAFKHGINSNGYTISIDISVENNVLHLVVQNTKGDYPQNNKGGLGLVNARKRLQLLYPNQHSLEILDQEEEFIVELDVKLKN
ncbi:sensor histidine kinase [Flammeovirga sp. EKP202]|uniref:sensor histidine kinase n=1 Tax=Flammeovirga sp. EKP202 TaxID=2770592 RepID=UPI00165F427A|nr:histidine kinase [Flammeovirga sp. EKP202]MBD0401003.1 histidine kinase [Flammeovirga sp. EKP202]